MLSHPNLLSYNSFYIFVFTTENSLDKSLLTAIVFATRFIDLVFLIIIEALRLLDTAKNAVILSVELRHCIKDIEQFVSDYKFLRDNGIKKTIDITQI